MTEARRHLYLDLEDTVISPVVEGWMNSQIINSAKLKAIIADYKPDFVHIFSFALHNDFEKRSFMSWKVPSIEQHFGIKLSFIPTIDGEIIPSVAAAMGFHHDRLDFMELVTLFGKQQAFRLFLRNHYRRNSTPVEVMLLDDDVFNETFAWSDIQVSGRILNIDQIKEPT